MQARVDHASPWPAYRFGMSARLRAFIIVSVAAHLVLFLLLSGSNITVTTIDHRLGNSTIYVSLSEAATPAKPARGNPPDAKRKIRDTHKPQTLQTEPAQNSVTDTVSVAAEQPINIRETRETSAPILHTTANTIGQQAKEAASASTETNSEAQRNYLLGQIHNQLSRHLDYPLRARRRGWEGEVLVGFHVSREGLLGNIHLARSSGYALLDRSAIDALRKVKSIPLTMRNGATRETGLQPVDLQLPVVYQLREG